MFQNPIIIPLFDLKIELGFRSGDIIYVLGDMDQDGFYYVSVNTMIVHKGLYWILHTCSSLFLFFQC